MPGMYNFDVSIFPPIPELVADFAEIGIQVKSFREPLKRSVQRVMAPSIAKNFEVGGRPAWAPLADYTVEFKSANGYPPDILVQTGKLKKVAQQLNAWTINTEEAYVSDLPGAEYGFYHMGGTRFMPQRIFMDVYPEDEDAIGEIFEEWVGERFAARGFI